MWEISQDKEGTEGIATSDYVLCLCSLFLSR